MRRSLSFNSWLSFLFLEGGFDFWRFSRWSLGFLEAFASLAGNILGHMGRETMSDLLQWKWIVYVDLDVACSAWRLRFYRFWGSVALDFFRSIRRSAVWISFPAINIFLCRLRWICTLARVMTYSDRMAQQWRVRRFWGIDRLLSCGFFWNGSACPGWISKLPPSPYSYHFKNISFILQTKISTVKIHNHPHHVESARTNLPSGRIL